MKTDNKRLPAIAVNIFSVHVGEFAAAIEEVVGPAQGELSIVALYTFPFLLEEGAHCVAYGASFVNRALAVYHLKRPQFISLPLAQQPIIRADEARHRVSDDVSVEVEVLDAHWRRE